MTGFTLDEVGVNHWRSLWLRGSFPRSFLALDDQASSDWRQAYLRTFLERDLPQLGIGVPAATLRRFWSMLAHYHGQVWNQAELARSLGVSEKTAGHYRDILEGTFMVRILKPWHENLGKRLVKSPKVYLADSGVAHRLLGIADEKGLWSHPKSGATWEGFCLQQILARFPDAEPWFWATQSGAELDLLLSMESRRFGFEIKLTETPKTTKSMVIAQKDLNLERLFIVYPGPRRFPLTDHIEALPLSEIQGLSL
jgi:predicted AAA+ superfamily ATPase